MALVLDTVREPIIIRKELSELATASVRAGNVFRAHGRIEQEMLAKISAIGERLPLGPGARRIDSIPEFKDAGQLLGELARLAVSTRNAVGSSEQIESARASQLKSILDKLQGIGEIKPKKA